MPWYQTHKFQYSLAGAIFGCCFPIIAVSIDIIRLGMDFSWASIVYVQSEFPIHLIINTAPIFLGLFALIGGIRQDRIAALNALLQADLTEKAKRLKQSHQDLADSNSTKNRLESELLVAREIQQNILPADLPANEAFQLHASLIPAKEVGGDFYDFYFLDADHLCLAVGDVSGKGVSAALLMAVGKTLLKSCVRHQNDLAAAVCQANEELSQNNQNYMFITLFVGILNIKTGNFIYTNAGHNAPLLQRADGQVEPLADRHGPVLGAVEGISYQASTTQLAPGDLLFIYTDGITEAHNPAGDLFSEKRLQRQLESIQEKAPKSVIGKILWAVREFEQGMPAFDDITALCIRWS